MRKSKLSMFRYKEEDYKDKGMQKTMLPFLIGMLTHSKKEMVAPQ